MDTDEYGSIESGEPPEAPRDTTELEVVSTRQLIKRSILGPFQGVRDGFWLFLIVFSMFNGAPGIGIWYVLMIIWKYWETKRRIQKRHRLYALGVPVKATVKFVGLDEAQDCLRNVHAWVAIWTYQVCGKDYQNKSGLADMPHNCTVGDEMWVLYEPDNPRYAKRWAIFTKPAISLPYADYFQYVWWHGKDPRLSHTRVIHSSGEDRSDDN